MQSQGRSKPRLIEAQNLLGSTIVLFNNRKRHSVLAASFKQGFGRILVLIGAQFFVFDVMSLQKLLLGPTVDAGRGGINLYFSHVTFFLYLYHSKAVKNA